MPLAGNRRNPRFALVRHLRSEGEARASIFVRKEGPQGKFGVAREEEVGRRRGSRREEEEVKRRKE